LLLLSSSVLMLLCFAGVAPSQTPAPETPPTTTTPETPPAETPAPQPQPPAPEAPPTGTAPTVTVPQVTVEAPKPRPARRAAPAAPARTATRPPPTRRLTPTPPTTPTTTTAGQPAAASPFQPPPSLDTTTSNQIQASQAQSLGNLLFTTPGATSAGLSPAASRPVLRGLSDFRVRVQENGIGALDVSDYGQDHGVPIDPLAVQKVEIYRGPEALRFGL
jgi:iron complex outermembrane receptor protein